MKTLTYDSLMNTELIITKKVTLKKECENKVIIIVLKDNSIVEYYDEQLFKYKNPKEYEHMCGMTIEDISHCDKFSIQIENVIKIAFKQKDNFNIEYIRSMDK